MPLFKKLGCSQSFINTNATETSGRKILFVTEISRKIRDLSEVAAKGE